MKTAFKPKQIKLDKISPHPRNYRSHPPDQIEHIKQSIRENGFYRNVVISSDNVILAGHGVVQAATELGLDSVLAVQLDIASEDPKALKVITGDNSISNLAADNDRMLTEILKEINEVDIDGLLGTGFDEQMLATLVMVTRSVHEIENEDEASEWLGLPDYDENDSQYPKLHIAFDDEHKRDQFIEQTGLYISKRGKTIWSAVHGSDSQQDLKSVRFDVE